MAKRKPNGYWKVREHCEAAAAEAGSRENFRIQFGAAYKSSLEHGWVDEFFPAPRNRKITPEEYEQWLAENRPELTVLEPYAGGTTKILHQCNQGHEPWLGLPGSIKQGSGCHECGRAATVAARALTTESYSAWLAENLPGWTVVGEYLGGVTPIEHRCEHGHAVIRAPKKVKAGRRTCGECTGHKTSKWTPEMYQGWLSENRPEVTALEPYVDAHTAIRHLWPCGHETVTSPHVVKKGQGCYRCRSPSDFNSVYAWIVIEAPDHVVVPLPGYHLIKTGLTSQKLGDDRPLNTMRNNQMQGEIIAICETSEGDAPYFEDVLQSLGVQPVFPDDQPPVDGKTEMRLVSDAELNEIRQFLGAQESALAMAA